MTLTNWHKGLKLTDSIVMRKTSSEARNQQGFAKLNHGSEQHRSEWTADRSKLISIFKKKVRCVFDDIL